MITVKNDSKLVGLRGNQRIQFGIIQRRNGATGIPDRGDRGGEISTLLLQFGDGGVRRFFNTKAIARLEQHWMKIFE